MHRGRGAQKDSLGARIELCRRLGLRTLVTGTGEPAEGRPDASNRNIMGADFAPATDALSGGRGVTPDSAPAASVREISAAVGLTARLLVVDHPRSQQTNK